MKTYFYHRGAQLISVILIAVVLFASASIRQFHTYSLKESQPGSLVEEQEAETSVLLPGISIGFEIH